MKNSIVSLYKITSFTVLSALVGSVHAMTSPALTRSIGQLARTVTTDVKQIAPKVKKTGVDLNKLEIDAVEKFKTSSAFNDLLIKAKLDAVNEFKGSSEFKKLIADANAASVQNYIQSMKTKNRIKNLAIAATGLGSGVVAGGAAVGAAAVYLGLPLGTLALLFEFATHPKI